MILLILYRTMLGIEVTLIREFRAEFLAISASLGLEKERENLRWPLLGRENDKYRHPETPEPCGAYILSLPLGSLPVSKSNCDDSTMSMVIGMKLQYPANSNIARNLLKSTVKEDLDLDP